MHGQESITKCDSEFTPLQCNLDQESTINSKLNQEKKNPENKYINQRHINQFKIEPRKKPRIEYTLNQICLIQTAEKCGFSSMNFKGLKE